MLNPIRIQASTLINRNRADVWAVLVDPEAWRAMLPANARIEVITDRTDQVGSRWKTINDRGGGGVEVLNEIVGLVPLHSHVVKSTWDKATNIVTTTLEPSDEGTVVRMETEIHWQPGLRTIVDRLAAAMTATQSSQRAMDKFTAIAEGRDDR